MSSTYLDLTEERQVVTSALLECDAFPAGMELFPATDDDAWTLITKVIDESDYYLLVIGGKYGSIDAVTEMSFTEKEYDYAVERRKPVMAFLHGNPDGITVEKSEIDKQRRKKLAAFREKVQTAKHVKYWTDAAGLEGAVALSFNKMIRHNPQVGWVKADSVGNQGDLRELLEAKRRIEKLESAIAKLESSPASLISGEELAHGQGLCRGAGTNHCQARSGTGPGVA